MGVPSPIKAVVRRLATGLYAALELFGWPRVTEKRR